MEGRPLRFRHQVIDDDTPGALLDVALIADVNEDGLPDIVGKPYQRERQVEVWFNETGVRPPG